MAGVLMFTSGIYHNYCWSLAYAVKTRGKKIVSFTFHTVSHFLTRKSHSDHHLITRFAIHFFGASGYSLGHHWLLAFDKYKARGLRPEPLYDNGPIDWRS